MSNLIEFGNVRVLESEAVSYRLKAAKLGRLARLEKDEAKMLALLHEALAWIELAQNEELLGTSEHRRLQ